MRKIPKSFKLFTLLASLGLVAACGPKTQTLYIPPTDIAGQQCVQQCRQANQVCQLQNELEYKDCLADEYHDELRYERYRNRQLAQGNKHDARLLARRHYGHSNFSCSRYSRFSCTRGYNQCFQACGGVIDVRTLEEGETPAGAPKLQVVTPPVSDSPVSQPRLGDGLR